jgi:hypothetical protein
MSNFAESKRVVECFDRHISEVVFPQLSIWTFVGNRLVETHICGISQTTERRRVEAAIFFAVHHHCDGN